MAAAINPADIVAAHTRVAAAIADLPSAMRNAPKQAALSLSPPSPQTPVDARVLVRARTSFGDTVHLAFGAHARPLELRCIRDGLWSAELRMQSADDLSLRFGVRRADCRSVEWQHTSRSLPVPPRDARGDVLICEDADDVTHKAFTSAAFSRVIFRRDPHSSVEDAARAQSKAVEDAARMRNVAVVFGVRAPRVEDDHAVYVLGNSPALGDWRAEDAVRLCDAHAPLWSVCVPLPRDHISRAIEYRFIIKHLKTGAVVAQEIGVRVLHIAPDVCALAALEGSAPVILAFVNSEFKYGTRWRGAGVALPVFSIRSCDSCGVGEFNDLPKLVDFCVATGHQLLQLLPVNDTTSHNDWRDSYPYSAVSCFALHPQYLNIESLGVLPDDMRVEYEEARQRLNALSEIDYEEVMRVKTSLVRRMYALHKAEFLKSAEFIEWFQEHQHWLVPYALFRFFMEINGTAQFDKWGKRARITPALIERFASADSFHFDYLGMVYYTQFHLHKQLEHASEYAAERQVVFKGDLPIGVNRYCADTWLNPHLFRLHMQSGAPPDSFSENGQNWGFPTYDWAAMKADGYAWWRQRLGHMARFFHAYRIDHILGFFRIWEIPHGFRTGMCGHFRPALPIRKSELEMRGLWDFDRYTLPYVHDALLKEQLGDDWLCVRDRFFEPLWGDRLRFLKEFDTERKVEAALPVEETMAESKRAFNEKVRVVLVRLLNNVILLRDEDDSDAFHPRFMMTKTSSYQELDSDEWKRTLQEMSDDYFYRRQDELWRASAMQKLPMMGEASDMLVCGEDLGFVPACVPSVMEETGILGLAVQRMPAGDAEFGLPEEYGHACVASTSSHDVSTLRAWWEALGDDARGRYWHDVLYHDGGAPRECSAEIVREILAQHLQSQAMWIITPIQDLIAMDERVRRPVAEEEQINVPSNPEHYWRFRLHLDMDAILGNDGLISKLGALNKEHGRGGTY